MIKLFNKFSGDPVLLDKTELQERVNIPDDTETELAEKLGVTEGNTIICREDEDLEDKLDQVTGLSSLSENTPGVLMIAPGSYSLSSDYHVTTDYIHVVSLTGQCDVKLEGGNIRWDNGKAHDDEDYDSCASGLMTGIDVSGTDDGFIWFPHNEPDVAFRNCRGGNWPISGDFFGRTIACDFKYNEELGDYFCVGGENSGTVSNNGSIGDHFCAGNGNQSGTVSHNGSIGDEFCADGENSGTVSHNGSIGDKFCADGENSGTVSHNGSIGDDFCNYGNQSGTVSHNGSIGDDFCATGDNSGTASHNNHDDSVQDLIDRLSSGGVLSNLTCSDGAIQYEEGT